MPVTDINNTNKKGEPGGGDSSRCVGYNPANHRNSALLGCTSIDQAAVGATKDKDASINISNADVVPAKVNVVDTPQASSDESQCTAINGPRQTGQDNSQTTEENISRGMENRLQASQSTVANSSNRIEMKLRRLTEGENYRQIQTIDSQQAEIVPARKGSRGSQHQHTEKTTSQRTESTQAFSQRHGIGLAGVSLSDLELAALSEPSTPRRLEKAERYPDVAAVRLAFMGTACGTRIFITPLIGPESIKQNAHENEPEGNDHGISWLRYPAPPLASETSTIPVQIVAVSQTTYAPGYKVKAVLPPGGSSRILECTIIFDPGRDDVLVTNDSNMSPIHIIPIMTDQQDDAEPIVLFPQAARYVSPGTYRLIVSASQRARADNDEDKHELVHVKIMPRRFISSKTPAFKDNVDAITQIETRKRPPQDAPSSVIVHGDKRARNVHGEGISSQAMIQHQVKEGNPLVGITESQMVRILGDGKENRYTLAPRQRIARNRGSEVFAASHSNMPAQLVAVKVLKTDNHYSLAHIVETWLKETHIHSRLTKSLSEKPGVSVLSMLSADARLLSMYQEHHPSRSLGSWPRWLSTGTHMFTGTMQDAHRVLVDMAAALEHVHAQGVLHNDIKPANILYSPERGAVLIDFGLASLVSWPCVHAGTPWYLPPEFRALPERGEASDMFALGVVALYLVGLLPLPDRLRRVEEWRIAHLHGHCPATDQIKAMDAMDSWLREVEMTKSNMRSKMKTLDEHVQEAAIYGAVVQMLQRMPEKRITAPKLVRWLDKRTVLGSG
ncbi:kinase-like domain-containing protein [Pseudomassariella vexata]|uniref:Kinase-like domain-containing protein n=1 Tax=Pseudomassariella vexata TaxID=1141098 RepID=A0A1Y2EKW3_9PEZI|nr:kinase-like domain-containing protein [Pseudomassariella vexata]ORY72182.1 kinase-like domain-containing protein [Pseudomassariella vexata]